MGATGVATIRILGELVGLKLISGRGQQSWYGAPRGIYLEELAGGQLGFSGLRLPGRLTVNGMSVLKIAYVAADDRAGAGTKNELVKHEFLNPPTLRCEDGRLRLDGACIVGPCGIEG